MVDAEAGYCNAGQLAEAFDWLRGARYFGASLHSREPTLLSAGHKLSPCYRSADTTIEPLHMTEALIRCSFYHHLISPGYVLLHKLRLSASSRLFYTLYPVPSDDNAQIYPPGNMASNGKWQTFTFTVTSLVPGAFL